MKPLSLLFMPIRGHHIPYSPLLLLPQRILEQLGSGQFGEVCKALWTVNDLTLELAVKMLIAGASEDDKVRFLQEAAIMGQFSHRNVIKLHGVVTVGEPVSPSLVWYNFYVTRKNA
jgi:serine/threonine protein kinase